MIGLAQTGSGKTGAFALPILQGLMDKPQELYALVLSPTRELAIQIAEQFEALGSGIGLKTAVLVGGIDMMGQAIALAKRPHVIVGTPGRVVDHLSNTKVGRQSQHPSSCLHLQYLVGLFFSSSSGSQQQTSAQGMPLARADGGCLKSALGLCSRGKLDMLAHQSVDCAHHCCVVVAGVYSEVVEAPCA